ncbi:hypothetical protein [Corynebacterium occultum]|uniref:hypothetical protein n=1 Tax=Corynebacterium occultum TaxID=2675219 RepID=UPI001E5671F4|nr:hypothetical protein [Corynebacterium occultum]
MANTISTKNAMACVGQFRLGELEPDRPPAPARLVLVDKDVSPLGQSGPIPGHLTVPPRNRTVPPNITFQAVAELTQLEWTKIEDGLGYQGQAPKAQNVMVRDGG